MDTLINALKAIAEPTRLRILALCQHDELTVSDLCRILGQSQPRISRHLKLLSEAGIVERLKEGSWVFHRLATEGAGGTLTKHISGLLPTGDEWLLRDQAELKDVKQQRNNLAADYFEKNATEWNSLRSLHVDEQDVETEISRLLPLTKRDILIDIGTGTGRMLEVLGPSVASGTGIDMSSEMLRIARSHLDKSQLDHCRVRQADMFRLPFTSESVDAAIIHQVLHFVGEPALAVSEAARSLKPGGYLLVVDFAPHSLESLRDDHAHHRLGFEDGEVEGWFHRSGIKTLKTTHLPGDPLTVTLWLGQKNHTQGWTSNGS